ncbi:MAG: hypothetical protein KatS3mg011_0609 [Acidimicrobiia bacterium]|nr:MAG: hypothetical protein KatS3mg011_0609 [Acidimicrobiia bacterium]
MAVVVKASQLPRLRSTRDGRERIDLVTSELFGFEDLKADYIRYRPGDTAAPHYHVGARHIWFIAEGRGIYHLDGETFEVEEGDVATAPEGGVHWFENPFDAPFGFYELWVPAPTETVWVTDDQ